MGTQPTADMTVEQWDAKYFEDFVNTDWFKKFTSTSQNAMIHVKEELVEKPGTKVHLTLVNELSENPLGENDLYEGNEKAVVMRDFAIEVHEYGLPIKFKEYDQQKTPISLRQVNKGALQTWNKKLHRDKIIKAMTDFYGNDNITKPMFNTGSVAAASETIKDEWLGLNLDRVLFGALLGNTSGTDHSASLANIDSSADKLTPAAIDLMKYMAKHPTAGKPKVRPMQPRADIDESDAYVLFAPSLCLRDLRDNSEFKQANREARQRGTDNPIFKGANYIWNNVAIYDIEEMPILVGAGNSTDVGVCKLMGAQAIGTAWAKRPWTTTKKLDYDRFEGMAIMQWYDVEKLRWGVGVGDKTSPCDHGMVTGYFSASAYA